MRQVNPASALRRADTLETLWKLGSDDDQEHESDASAFAPALPRCADISGGMNAMPWYPSNKLGTPSLVVRCMDFAGEGSLLIPE